MTAILLCQPVVRTNIRGSTAVRTDMLHQLRSGRQQVNFVPGRHCTALYFCRCCFQGILCDSLLPPPRTSRHPTPAPLLRFLAGETYEIRDHKYSKMGRGVAYDSGLSVTPATMTTCTGEAFSNVSRGDYHIPDRRFGKHILSVVCVLYDTRRGGGGALWHTKSLQFKFTEWQGSRFKSK